MSDRKAARRAQRYLRLLAGGPALLRATGDPETKLLEFPGRRSVRCRRADLDAMARAGAILVGPADDGEQVSITAEGRAAARRGDGDPADQHRIVEHARIRIGDRDEIVAVNRAESPLSALARLRAADGTPWLDHAELAAGERLRRDFEQAMLQPRVTASWDASRVARGGKGTGNAMADLADRALSARKRVGEAVEAVGPDLGNALVDICCFLKGLEQVERERGWPRRSAKLMLKTALAMLDRHYHPQVAGGRRRAGILHWGGADYRPRIGG